MAVIFEEDQINNAVGTKRVIIDKSKPVFNKFLVDVGIVRTAVEANWLLIIISIILLTSSFFIFKLAGERFSQSQQGKQATVNVQTP